MQTNATKPADLEVVSEDLGPLAWVLDELRKSLDSATRAMRRFVRDAELARGSELAELDASQLRIARQQLHQAVGALEMVGWEAPAKVLRAMEALAQKFIQRPEHCSDEAAVKMERASFAVTEYLEGILKGRSASPVALFPQYRDVLALVEGERVHPADLWPLSWKWADADVPVQQPARPYDSRARATMDQAVLNVVKRGDVSAALSLRNICLGFATAQEALEPRAFWKICAAYFEALAHDLCPPDLYVKRAASRILTQYASLARGDQGVSDRLAQDLLFFCVQALPDNASETTPVLNAVCAAYGFTRAQAVDYHTPQFGRFDPALLAQARKRIAAATESWSALAGGDFGRSKAVADQFASVNETLLKLHPESVDLARALTRAVETTTRSGQPPSTAVAMEVATSVLYLDAAYEDRDPRDASMTDRSARLAQRLAHVLDGAEPEPLESWMEELYRRVSERQTIGSVVDELRTALAAIEQSLDQFFRQPQDRTPLHEVPSQLAQMRGVFSVLGLDQASLAALRMRQTVEQFLVDGVGDTGGTPVIFERLGNSLGAMGFLIDMLSYQRLMAKKLFVYDEALGEFKPVMGREKVHAELPAVEPSVSVPVPAPVASAPLPVAIEPEVPVVASAQPPEEDDDAELRDIFLEEAREVVEAGLQALERLAVEPPDLGAQTTLRRAFHTLKGSARMVNLNEFGEAAWAFEQLLNTWLADQKPASAELTGLSNEAVHAFGRWVQDISSGTDAGWSAAPFRKAADALRLAHQRLALEVPGADNTPALPVALPQDDIPAVEIQPVQARQAGVPRANEPEHAVADADDEHEHDRPEFEATQMYDLEADAPVEPRVDFEATQMLGFPSHDQPAAESTPADDAPLNLDDFDFGDLPPSGTDAAVAAASDSQDTAGAPLSSADVDTPTAAAELSEELADEQVKVVGPLRISIPLYNVYLNEADEWSRRLQTELGEWALELHRPLPQTAVVLAHSLGGSSATVGFVALSDIARLLEQALAHVQLHGQGLPGHAAVFNDAAEDVRRLLHQFAAGFLREPTPAIVDGLQGVLDHVFAEPDSALPAEEPTPEAVAVSSSAAWDALAPASIGPAYREMPSVQHTGFGAAVAISGDDDIEARDALDADLFPIFEEEAVELLPQLAGALRQWVARPDNVGARNETLRVLHTLKGSARLAGAMRLGEMAHRMESDIEQLGTDPLPSAEVEPLLTRFDALSDCFDALTSTAEQVLSLPEAPKSAVQDLPPAAIPQPALALSQPARQPPGQTVRVRSQLLDRLLNQAGEVIITRSRLDVRLGQLRSSLDDLTGNLERLRSQLREIEVQAESQMQTRLALSKESDQAFDPLEFDRFTRVQELTRMMAESVNDVATVQRNLQRTVQGTEDDLIAQARQARELQRDLLRSRMVEFEGIAERLYGVVRQSSKEVGKQVRLDIMGGSMEMDRSVLDRMTPAFEHILRNAVAHGIEDAAAREAAGKPAVGGIVIDVRQESNAVAVSFSDDGAGLDLARVRAKAISRGMIAADAELPDDDMANLIFEPGFSTSDAVSELSGRGIGLDVVRAEVNALGGRIETRTEPGKGTQFRLVLPLTTAVTQVVMLRMGELAVGVPANVVETVRRVPAAELDQSYADGSFAFDGEALPFFWSGALLQASARSLESDARHFAVAVFRSAGQRIAAHVDEVLGNQEVVVKNLGPQLARLPGLTGMSVLASGAVALIYNPVALASVYGEQARRWYASAGVPAQDAQADRAVSAGLLTALGESKAPLVLVVDDSITVRRVTQRLLKREGYRVALAADGLQALEQLRLERPAVVLSDIEMPRMDGFDLARNIRADDALRDLPIIMITSRIAEKHREHARELGVDHYLGKPYPEDELLGLVKQYCLTDI